jgi:hypothetical protein
MCLNRSSLSSSVLACCWRLSGCCPQATVRRADPAQVHGCHKAQTRQKAGLYETSRQATQIPESSDGLSRCPPEEGAVVGLLWVETRE